ncbi:hypothetical protein [Cypionkella sp.]|uniref:hypothetical protein n=1 Tax=Cypionkella sp. TaxID=2811411 RepID=UPI002630405F|nr:hypothetical protein [Cypionkella sp.]MDB5663551.1 hypothetical protein [Cypionkella sp.]
MKAQFLAAFKRAARQSPIHSEVITYAVAIEGGVALVDSEGRFVYREQTRAYGFIDLEAEAAFTVPESPYAGAVSITVQLAGTLDLRHMLKMGETLYAVEAVRGGDSVGLAVKVTARAVSDPHTLLDPIVSHDAP